jgi:hypothetical protein
MFNSRIFKWCMVQIPTYCYKDPLSIAKKKLTQKVTISLQTNHIILMIEFIGSTRCLIVVFLNGVWYKFQHIVFIQTVYCLNQQD